MVSDRLPRQGLILLAALSLFWGANWPVMKMVLSEVPPLYFRSCCLLLSGVGMLALARLSGIPIKVPSGQWHRVLWLAVFNISGWNALVIIGVSLLPSGRAALLGYTMPLWSMLLSAVFLGDRLSGRTVLGLLLGLAGIVVLMGGSVEGMLQAPVGVLCMILGAWSWATGVVLFKRIPVSMPTSALTGWMMLAILFVLSPLSAAFGAWTNPDLLYSVAQAEKIVGDSNWVILDCRGQEVYEKGHIPGAIVLG